MKEHRMEEWQFSKESQTEKERESEKEIQILKECHSEKEPQLLKVSNIEDYQAIEVLANEIWREHYSSILSKEQIDYMIQRFQSVEAMQKQVKVDSYEYYKIYWSDSFAGYFAIQQQANTLFLSKIYIHKDYRGHGLGQSVFSMLERKCTQLGLDKIWLTVNRFNEGSIKFYEKQGFLKVRTQIADIGNGFVMDDYIMEKAIG